MKRQYSRAKQFIKRSFILKERDEARFRLENSFKMILIPFLSLVVTCVLFSILLKMDLIFFEANGLFDTRSYKEAYYDFLISRMFWMIPFLVIFFTFIFLSSLYLSHLLLRPFRVIGDYCEKALNGETTSYDPDFFTDLKLLTSFSEWFFNFMETSKLNKNLIPQKIPEKFTKIHTPVFETRFFVQYSMFIFITSICAALAIKIVAIDLHNHVVDLAYKTLSSSEGVEYFFKHQTILFESTLYVVLSVHILSSIILAFHLYSKVSTPAFAIFATMRSFSKGNHENRVHLVGYPFIRPYSRQINRYLDVMSGELKEKSKKVG